MLQQQPGAAGKPAAVVRLHCPFTNAAPQPEAAVAEWTRGIDGGRVGGHRTAACFSDPSATGRACRSADPRARRAADFFDGKHFVLRGSSSVTHPAAARDSFRNFYQRAYPYVFAKFRLAYDPA